MGGPPMSGNSNANGAREGVCGAIVGGIVAAPSKKIVREEMSRNRNMAFFLLEWRASTLKLALSFEELRFTSRWCFLRRLLGRRRLSDRCFCWYRGRPLILFHPGADRLDAFSRHVDSGRSSPRHFPCFLHVVVNHFHVWRECAAMFALVNRNVVFQRADNLLRLRRVFRVNH